MKFKTIYEALTHYSQKDDGEIIIESVDMLDPKNRYLLEKIDKLINVAHIKEVLNDSYYKNPNKKSRVTDKAAKAVVKLISNHLIAGASIDDLAKVVDRKFPLDKGLFGIEKITSEMSKYVETKFFSELSSTYLSAGMGPGELLLWALCSNVDFNDGVGDLIIDGSSKIEVKGTDAILGTNSDPFKSWAEVKKQVFKVLLEHDYANIKAFSNGVDYNKGVNAALYGFISTNKQNVDVLEQIAPAMINTYASTKDPKVVDDMMDAFMKCNSPEELFYSVAASHVKAYQLHDSFDYIMIINGTTGGKTPVSYILEDPSSLSSYEFGRRMATLGIKLAGWSSSRRGGMRMRK